VKMFKLREIIGLPILVLDTGENVGEAKDLVFELTDRKVLALILKSGLFGGSKAVLFDGIEKIGEDTVAVSNKRYLVKAKTIASERPVFGERLIGSKVFSEDGKKVGILEDVAINIDDGSIAEIEVSCGWLSDISEGLVALPGLFLKNVGKDFVIISSEFEKEAHQTGGAKDMFQSILSGGTKVAKGMNSALLSREAKYALGRVSVKTVKDAEGNTIVAKDQKIEEEHIMRAKSKGKLHELVLAAGLSSAKEKWAELKKKSGTTEDFSD